MKPFFKRGWVLNLGTLLLILLILYLIFFIGADNLSIAGRFEHAASDLFMISILVIFAVTGACLFGLVIFSLALAIVHFPGLAVWSFIYLKSKFSKNNSKNNN